MSAEFSRSVVNLSVAELCTAVGYDSVTESAQEALTEVFSKYLQNIAKRSHEVANLAGKTESNYLDVKNVLQHYFKLNLDDLRAFAANREQITLSKAIPDFPVTKKRAADDRNPSQPPSQQQKLSHDEHKPAHVQNWLPPFPDPHLYAETPAFAEKNLTVKQLRKKRGKQNRKIQTALATLDDALGRKPINNYEVSVSDSIKADQPKSDSMLTDQNTNTTTTSSTNNTTTNLPLPTMPSAPTPIDKSNPHLSTLANAQHMDVDDDLRKPFSEVDENEKQRRKNKAAALLGIQYDRGMLRPEDIPTDRK